MAAHLAASEEASGGMVTESSVPDSSVDLEPDENPTLELLPVTSSPETPSRSPRRRLLSILSLLVVVASIPFLVNFSSYSLHRWSKIFVEDFDTPVAMGQFPGTVYGDRWMSYDGFADTSGVGLYAPADVLSVHDGALDLFVHTGAAGRPLVAAPVPLVGGLWGGQKYGRYEIRFKAEAIAGYKAAWLLWPDSNDWNEGEIDFPEGGFDGKIQAFQHCVGNPERNCLAVDTGVDFSGGWHTTVIEWTPHGVRYLLDGTEVATTWRSPSVPMHFVLQTETNSATIDPSVSGHILVDSVRIWSW